MPRAKLMNWDSAGLEPEVQWDRDGFGMDLFSTAGALVVITV